MRYLEDAVVCVGIFSSKHTVSGVFEQVELCNELVLLLKQMLLATSTLGS